MEILDLVLDYGNLKFVWQTLDLVLIHVIEICISIVCVGDKGIVNRAR
jgi:hypothetical protein